MKKISLAIFSLFALALILPSQSYASIGHEFSGVRSGSVGEVDHEIGTFSALHFQPASPYRMFYDDGTQWSGGATTSMTLPSIGVTLNKKFYVIVPASIAWVQGTGVQAAWEVTGTVISHDVCSDGDTLAQCIVKINSGSTGKNPFLTSTGFIDGYWMAEGKYMWSSGTVSNTITLTESQYASVILAPNINTVGRDALGFGLSEFLTFMTGQFLLIMGGGVGMLQGLMVYIVFLAIAIGAIYFLYRAFRFMRH